MSYMRYPVYVWSDGVYMHLSATDEEHEDAMGGHDELVIRHELFDQLVLCRFAELVESGQLRRVVQRVQDPDSPVTGNFGSWPILHALGRDPEGEFAKSMEEA